MHGIDDARISGALKLKVTILQVSKIQVHLETHFARGRRGTPTAICCRARKSSKSAMAELTRVTPPYEEPGLQWTVQDEGEACDARGSTREAREPQALRGLPSLWAGSPWSEGSAMGVDRSDLASLPSLGDTLSLGGDEDDYGPYGSLHEEEGEASGTRRADASGLPGSVVEEVRDEASMLVDEFAPVSTLLQGGASATPAARTSRRRRRESDSPSWMRAAHVSSASPPPSRMRKAGDEGDERRVAGPSLPRDSAAAPDRHRDVTAGEMRSAGQPPSCMVYRADAMCVAQDKLDSVAPTLGSVLREVQVAAARSAASSRKDDLDATVYAPVESSLVRESVRGAVARIAALVREKGDASVDSLYPSTHWSEPERQRLRQILAEKFARHDADVGGGGGAASSQRGTGAAATRAGRREEGEEGALDLASAAGGDAAARRTATAPAGCVRGVGGRAETQAAGAAPRDVGTAASCSAAPLGAWRAESAIPGVYYSPPLSSMVLYLLLSTADRALHRVSKYLVLSGLAERAAREEAQAQRARADAAIAALHMVHAENASLRALRAQVSRYVQTRGAGQPRGAAPAQPQPALAQALRVEDAAGHAWRDPTPWHQVVDHPSLHRQYHRGTGQR